MGLDRLQLWELIWHYDSCKSLICSFFQLSLYRQFRVTFLMQKQHVTFLWFQLQHVLGTPFFDSAIWPFGAAMPGCQAPKEPKMARSNTCRRHDHQRYCRRWLGSPSLHKDQIEWQGASRGGHGWRKMKKAWFIDVDGCLSYLDIIIYIYICLLMII